MGRFAHQAYQQVQPASTDVDAPLPLMACGWLHHDRLKFAMFGSSAQSLDRLHFALSNLEL